MGVSMTMRIIAGECAVWEAADEAWWHAVCFANYDFGAFTGPLGRVSASGRKVVSELREKNYKHENL